MSNTAPIYDTKWQGEKASPRKNSKQFGIRIARKPGDLMEVFAIRAAVFLAEQNCPYHEEFDGNDLSATHIIGYLGDEPIACIRAQFFADFCKIERLAVRHEYRNTRMSFTIVKAAIELARKKGYRRVYGHSQDRLLKFWGHFGAKPMKKNYDLTFSDFSYTEVVLDLEPHPDPITIESDPYIIIRPEGAWHRRGILEESAGRPATSPLRDLSIS